MKALVVDDHAVVREGLRRVLAILPAMEIRDAATGAEALTQAQEHRPDLILLDLHLPGLGGIELLRRLLGASPNSRILVFSMHSEVMYAARALQAGARGYVSKNASPDELRVALGRVIEGGRYVESEIAQELAVHFPERVRTLTSIMSSTGDPSLPQATPAALAVLSRDVPPDKDGYVASYVRSWAVLNGDLLPFNAERTARTASTSFDRGINPAGVARQMLAIISSGNRTGALGSLDVPTLVIHGTNDPLVPVEAGHATARAVPGAKLDLVEGMGHTLPRQTWPQIADAIAAHAR